MASADVEDLFLTAPKDLNKWKTEGIYHIRDYVTNKQYDFLLTKSGEYFNIVPYPDQNNQEAKQMIERVSMTDYDVVRAPSLEFMGPGTDVGTHDIKIVKVGDNIYDIRYKEYPASSHDGGRLSHKRSSRRRRRTYHKKRISLKRGRSRSRGRRSWKN